MFWGSLILCATLGVMAPPTFEDVEAKAIEKRESIRAAVIEVDSDTKLYKNKELSRRNQLSAKVFVDESRIRCDYVRVSRTDENTSYRQSYCWTQDALYLYTDETAPDGAKIISKIVDPQQKNANQIYAIPDPRLLGYVCNTFASFVQADLRDTLTNSQDEISKNIETDKRNNNDCYKLVRKKPYGTITTWIDFNRDFNVVAIEKEFDSGKRVMDVELQMVENYGWFPSKIRFEWHHPDGTLNREEDLKIHVVQINQPLREVDFSPKGMPIPLGSIIHDHRQAASRELIMTQDGLVPHLGADSK